jgi:hypothetical protein
MVLLSVSEDWRDYLLSDLLGGRVLYASKSIAVCSLASRDHAEASEYKIVLDKARRALRMQSRSFDMMRFALLKMDAIFWVGFDKVFTSDLEIGAKLKAHF